MINYLTKDTNEQTLHFRTMVDGKLLFVIQGQFYQWISKVNKICNSEDNAMIEAAELIEEKRMQGYRETRFEESKENSFDVYDKGEFHYGGNFPAELKNFQGLVHTGMYIGWLIDNDLINPEYFEEVDYGLDEFKKRIITGPEFYRDYMDETFRIEALNETGNKFSLEYFDFDGGQYLNDYIECLAQGLPTFYHVQDCWENYNKIKVAIDERFSNWNANTSQQLQKII